MEEMKEVQNAKKRYGLGGFLTGIAIAILLLIIFIDQAVYTEQLADFLLAISFASLGAAYILVFVRKGRRDLVLILGAFVGGCFFLLAFSSLFQFISLLIPFR